MVKTLNVVLFFLDIFGVVFVIQEIPQNPKSIKMVRLPRLQSRL
jgi:hypothetical protein